MVRIISKFIQNNAYPEITLYVALKCYKMLEREHRKLGNQYLKERVDLTEAVIQIETLLEEEKDLNDESALASVKSKLSQKEIDALGKIFKATDER
jgi:hypothetical protein